MFRVFVSLAMAVLWTVVANAQPANSRLDDIIKRGTLRVGMTGDYRPFTYFDKTTSKFTRFRRRHGGRRLARRSASRSSSFRRRGRS